LLAFVSARSSNYFADRVMMIRTLDTGATPELPLTFRFRNANERLWNWMPDSRSIVAIGHDGSVRGGLHRIDLGDGSVSPLAVSRTLRGIQCEDVSVASAAKQLAVAIAHTSVHHQHVRRLRSTVLPFLLTGGTVDRVRVAKGVKYRVPHAATMPVWKLTVAVVSKALAGVSAAGTTLIHSAMVSASADMLVFAAATVPYGNRLEAVDRSGHRLRFWEEPEAQNWPRLSPDGQLLARQRVDPLRNTPDVWVEDLVRGTKPASQRPWSLTYGPSGLQTGAIWLMSPGIFRSDGARGSSILPRRTAPA
jgi:hypothetical protein